MLRHVIIAGCLLLGACGTTTVIDKQLVTAMPSEALYQCSLVPFPDPTKLTDRQVAKLLEQLAYENHKCYNSLRAIHAFEEKANGTVTPNKKVLMSVRQVVRDNPQFITCEVSESSSLALQKTPCHLSQRLQN